MNTCKTYIRKGKKIQDGMQNFSKEMVTLRRNKWKYYITLEKRSRDEKQKQMLLFDFMKLWTGRKKK